MLLNWFGLSLSKIHRDLHKEIIFLESVLKYPSRDYPKGRIDLLKKIVNDDKRLNVENIIDDGLHKLEKSGKDILVAETLLMLQNDFHEDYLWKELKQVWKNEFSALKNNNFLKAKKYFNKQVKIATLIEKINKLEFHETHMHFAPSADPHFHWEELKKQWNSPNLRALLLSRPELKSSQKLTLSKIMNSSESDVFKFIKFSKFLILTKKRSFSAFRDKGNILNAIQIVGTQFNRENYLKNALINIVKHCLKNNIRYIEIRYPIQYKWQYEEFAKIAKNVEKKYGVFVRFVNFLIGIDKNESIKNYSSLKNPEIKKYFVGFDSFHITDSPLPVANHAGEYLNQGDFNFFKGDDNKNFSRAKNIIRSLHEIEVSLKLKKIKRIGHGSVLALDIDDYLSKSKPNELVSSKADIRKAKNLQKRLLKDISSRKGKDKIYIEANPTSNVMIAGFKYKTHPIKTFQEHKISYAISTDDRVIFNTNMKKEFYRIARALNWSEKNLEEAAKMQKESIFGNI